MWHDIFLYPDCDTTSAFPLRWTVLLFRPPRGCHVLSTSSFSLSLYSLSLPLFISSLSSLPLSDGLSLPLFLSSLSSLPLSDGISLSPSLSLLFLLSPSATVSLATESRVSLAEAELLPLYEPRCFYVTVPSSSLKQQAETEDPELVAVGVVRAAADHEAVVFAKLAGIGELAIDDPEDVSSLALLSKSLHEDVEVSAVDLSHIIRVPCRLQQSVSPLPVRPPHSASQYRCSGRRRRERAQETQRRADQQ